MKLLPLVVFSVYSFAQTEDIGDHLAMIKQLMPEATRLGVLYNQRSDPGVDQALAIGAAKTGLRVFKVSVESIRDISGAMRALRQHDVDLMYLVDDRIITASNSIKFVVKYTVKEGKPVFASGEDALRAGAFGEFYKEGDQVKLRINGQIRDKIDVKIPEGDQNITVEE